MAARRRTAAPTRLFRTGWCLTGPGTHNGCVRRVRSADDTRWHVCQCPCHDGDESPE